MDSVLRVDVLQDGSPTVQWTDEMQKAFVYLKTTLNSAPALGLLDSKLHFHLHMTKKEGFASGPVGP